MIPNPRQGGEEALVRGQTEALIEIQRLSDLSAIRYVGHTVVDDDLAVGIELATCSFEKSDGGLPVQERERLVVLVSANYPHVPPDVYVDHDRWLNQPHVLQGHRLCLYLDPPAEWDPTEGVRGLFRRLWDWFADATAQRYNPSTALYHPVGGVLHRTPGSPTIVLHLPLGDTSTFTTQKILLRSRRPHRIDVEALSLPPHGPAEDQFRGLLVALSDVVPRGAGMRLSDLCNTIRGQDSRSERKRFLGALSKVAQTLRGDEHLVVLIAVPNRQVALEESSQLIAFRLPQHQVDDAVRAATYASTDPDALTDEPVLEWLYVDDNRRARTIRRDSSRPINWFTERRIELWGCGALGSWIAEHVVRAGASQLTLRDPGYVSSGLLVRQNFTQQDVGLSKVEALARRLGDLSDCVDINPRRGFAQQGLDPDRAPIDLIIDCTVSTAVTVALDAHQASGRLAIPVVQVATDQETASLGLVTVTDGSSSTTTNSLDKGLYEMVAGDADLAAYGGFWNASTVPPLVPTAGCSVPTFRGSGADVSVVAATAISLAVTALGRRVSAGYLFAAPHAPFDIPPRVSHHPASG